MVRDAKMSKGYNLGVQSTPKNKGIVSKEQREILDMLTNQYMTPKQIANSRGTSVWAVYKTMNKLKKKSFLSGTSMGGYKKPEPLRMGGSNNQIRLHGQEFNIKIITSSQKYQNTILKCSRIDFKGHTTRLYKDSIEIYSKQEFFAEDAQRATALSIQHFNKIFYQLEDHLKIMLMKPGSMNIKQVNAHYSEINNEYAEECNEKKVKLNIYTEEDGKLWFKIDNSFQLNEAETVHPVTSKQDMEGVKPFFNDLRKNPTTLSEIREVMKEQAEINKDTAAGLNIVVGQLKRTIPKEESVVDLPPPDYFG